MKQTMALLACGGTLDKDYHPISGELVFVQTHLHELLQQSNHRLALRTQVVMLKDSLDMTDADREQLLQACIKAEEKQIVITHGTDTMTTSADFLMQNQTVLNEKTIVLTGAMRPFKLGQSDAPFNLGSALMAAQLLPAGVYVCMNGQIFNANQVQKNRQLGIFETI
jgi:L-asparaginase